MKDLNSSSQSIKQASEIIYDYWYECATERSPQTVIQEFRNLFFQGRNKDIKVSKALEKIIFATASELQFPLFFSNCFYVIFDRWSRDPQSLSCVSELVASLETISQASSYDRRRKQLIALIKNYQESPAYFQLQAVLAIINPQKIANVILASGTISNNVNERKSHTNTTINTYLARYTYLYQYLLPSELNLEQLKQFIYTLQSDRQKDFEFKLSQHILYRFRLKEVARMKLLSKGAGKVITKVDNPSLLSEKSFRIALQQYLGKIEKKQTILMRSQRFLTDNQLRNSYQEFKQDLHRFLCKNVQSRHENYQFQQKLAYRLKQMFPQSNTKPLNNTLILQTSRQLYSYLIVDLNNANNPARFADLIANLGTAQVAIVLIKIALICPESKADLEKKIAAIVTNYQMYDVHDAPWVIKTLEHLLIAFGIYFGNIDVSLARSALSK